ncbi:unnamed protein product [Paramecium sonneborni]|uniref:Uncharacterized protein n=1 Tax=Paramecium sonneborni TaxID=65129 RepID=A0A8S1RA69_9CILI|nr:unnamed protein product [Paramecium sonneborni]
MTEITKNEILKFLSSEQMLEQGILRMKQLIELKNELACKTICLVLYEILKDQNFEPTTKLLAIKLSQELMNLKDEQFVFLYGEFVLNALKQYVEFRPQDSNPLKGQTYFGENGNQELKQVGIQLVSMSLQCIQVWAQVFAVNRKGRPSEYLVLYGELKEKGVQLHTKFQFQGMQNVDIYPLFNVCFQPLNQQTFKQIKFKNLTPDDAIRLAHNYLQKKEEIQIYLSQYCQYQRVYENFDLSLILFIIEKINFDIESLVDQLGDFGKEDIASKVSMELDNLNIIKKLIIAIISEPNYSQFDIWIKLRQQCKQHQDTSTQINEIKALLQQKFDETHQKNTNNSLNNELLKKKQLLEQIEKQIEQKQQQLVQLIDQLSQQQQAQLSSNSSDSNVLSTIQRQSQSLENQIQEQNNKIQEFINMLQNKNHEQNIQIQTLQSQINRQKNDSSKNHINQAQTQQLQLKIDELINDLEIITLKYKFQCQIEEIKIKQELIVKENYNLQIQINEQDLLIIKNDHKKEQKENGELKSQIQQLQEQNEQLQIQIQQLQKQNEQLQIQIQQLSKQNEQFLLDKEQIQKEQNNQKLKTNNSKEIKIKIQEVLEGSPKSPKIPSPLSNQFPNELKKFQHFPQKLDLSNFQVQFKPKIPLTEDKILMIFPHQNPQEYYEHKKKTQKFGQMIQPFQIKQLDRINPEAQKFFKLSCLGQQNILFENDQLKICLDHRTQILEEKFYYTFGLYINNKKQQTENFKIEFENTERFKYFWSSLQRNENSIGSKSTKQIEIAVRSNDDLQTDFVKLTISNLNQNLKIQIPIHICQQIQYENTSLSKFETKWNEIVEEKAFITPIFSINMETFINIDHFMKKIPNLILDNNKVQDYDQGFDDLEIKGVGQYQRFQFFIIFELIPQNKMQIQIRYNKTQSEDYQLILKKIAKEYAFIFGQFQPTTN